MGKFRRYNNPSDAAKIALGGILGSLIAISVLRFVALFISSPIIETAILGGAIHLVLSLVPFELLNIFLLRHFDRVTSHSPGDGLHIIWWSWFAYLCAFTFSVFFALAVVFTNGPIPVLLIAAISVFCAWAYSKWLTH